MVFVNEKEKKAENRVWLESILEEIGKALYTTDEKGRILEVNNAALEVLGRPRKEIIGLPISEVTPVYNALDDSEVQFPIAEAVAKKRILSENKGLYLKNRQGKKEFATYTVLPSATLGDEGEVMVMVCNYDLDLRLEDSPRILLKKCLEESHGPAPAFFTKRNGQFVRVLIRDILWIEAMENYAQVVTLDDRFVVHSTMKSLATRMQDNGFVRVHRSFIIPIDRVDAIEENRLRIGKKEIPIGKSFRQKLMKALNFI
ncbi:MAG TPA: PAS domain S-box protein [Bacteroidetes bacterium]|nr:PAS domain S-box protein [Bacteroidota bacterium]